MMAKRAQVMTEEEVTQANWRSPPWGRRWRQQLNACGSGRDSYRRDEQCLTWNWTGACIRR